MKKTAAFLVDNRKRFLCLFLILAAASLLSAGRVRINYDLTRYLPADSHMREGMALMEREFGPASSSALRVMFKGLSETEKAAVFSRLSDLAQPSAVTWEPGDGYNRGDLTLFEITAEFDSHSEEAATLYRAVHAEYNACVTGGTIHEANVPVLAPGMVVLAVALVLVILLIMCRSWFEPIVFLVNIGIAVVINLGTNVVFESVSEYTNSIVGIMQLVLSMDYSIILLNRYTQEKEKGAGNLPAMKAAVAAAFPAVTGSSLTTFAGLMCLAFMSFGLGADMGFALAKSVMSDRWIMKTRKKALHIPMTGYSRVSVRGRFAFAALFTALFLGAFFLKNSTQILYMLQTNNPVEEVFGERNSLVLLYETKDSARIAEALAPFEEDEKVQEITGYYNTLGKAYTAEEIAELFGDGLPADPAMIRMVYQRYASRNGITGEIALTPAELVRFIRTDIVDDPLFSVFINGETRQQIENAEEMIRENAVRLEGEHYGRVILTTVYPEDSAETRAFIGTLSERCANVLEGETWLIGTSVMNEEMARTFDAELDRITLLSALAIFIVVALTFRSLAVPLVLVLTVQCGIYLTMAFIALSGGGMYYLALLMVQCILMGATVDYGILYTSYYRECRANADRETAIRNAYDGSLHTVLTSALIMIAAAGVLGFVFANPAIGEICLTISRGAISATLLIVFLLPGVLAALDRFVRPRSGRRDTHGS